MKRIFLATGLLFFIFQLLSAQKTIRIYPTDDTYIHGGNNKAKYDRVQGLDDPLQLKSYYNKAKVYQYTTYLKFDLSKMSANPEWIQSIKLHIYGKSHSKREHILNVSLTNSTSWAEDDLCYNTHKETGKNKFITNTREVPADGKWITWDLTGKLQRDSHLKGNLITLEICDSTNIKDESGKGDIVVFKSKENNKTYRPYLEITQLNKDHILLSDININGSTIENFSPYQLNYTVKLKADAKAIPSVEACPFVKSAKVNIESSNQQSPNDREQTTIISVKNKGESLNYSIHFIKAPITSTTTIKQISIDGEKIEFFKPGKKEYRYYLPYNYKQQTPLISITKENPNQQVKITPPQSLTGKKEERTSYIQIISGDRKNSNTYRIIYEILPPLDIFICIGQSNMCGRGYMDESKGDLKPVDNTFLLTPALKWEIASNPFNKYSSVRNDISVQQISPSYGFAHYLSRHIHSKIGMIVNGRGGTSISEWTKGSGIGLYEAAIERAKEAQKWGRIKAILWHQGEGDDRSISPDEDWSNPSKYPCRLREMITNFRKDLNEPNLWFIAGELGHWRIDSKTQHSRSQNFNNMIRQINKHIPYTDYVKADELVSRGDLSDSHFSRESCITLGERYAQKVLQYIYNKEKIAIYGNKFNTLTFKNELAANNIEPSFLTRAELNTLSIDKGALLLLSGETPLPPESRIAINRYLSNGGNIILVGDKGFDYTPQATDEVPLIKFSDRSSYQISREKKDFKAGSLEKAIINIITLPNGKEALELSTTRKAMHSTMIKIPVQDKAKPELSLLTFNAKGSPYMDLLAIEIVDNAEKRWYNFIKLTNTWDKYTISFADFVPEDYNNPNEAYRLLWPENIRTISLGVNLLTVWREKEMHWAVSSLSLAKNKKDIYAPTSALKPMEIPFKENNICFPTWLFDPFWGERNNFQPYPGSKMGTDVSSKYDTKKKRESRIIPIHSHFSSPKAEQPIANLELYAGGEYKGSAVATFNLPPATVLKNQESRKALSNMANYLLKKPRIIATKLNTCTTTQGTFPQLRVTIKNPLHQTMTGTLHIEIAGKLLCKESNIIITPLRTKEYDIVLPEIPEDFPFQHFNWQITLTTDEGGITDTFCDSVDVEKAMLYAFKHLIRNQQFYPDGRISHHYFGDAYGVRAMSAYLHFLQKEKHCGAQSNNTLPIVTSEEIENCVFRFYDMLADRQSEDGKLPMGYLEHSGGYNVADGGQIALAIAQSLRYITDPVRKGRYQRLCSRFFNWAETFYIDSIRSASLRESHPQEFAKGHANEGMYGLGEYGKKKIQTGPSWVGADILAFQLCMGILQKDSTQMQYQAIAKRNANYYVKATYPASGYYQAEALFWVRLALHDDNLNKIIDDNLRRTFLPPLLKGRENEMYLRGGRCTLNALPLIYYREYIQDSPELRAVLLKYIWAFGSESSFSSMKRLSEAYPKAVHGESLAVSKYAALSALWAMELLVPGSTILQEMRNSQNIFSVK